MYIHVYAHIHMQGFRVDGDREGLGVMITSRAHGAHMYVPSHLCRGSTLHLTQY